MSEKHPSQSPHSVVRTLTALWDLVTIWPRGDPETSSVWARWIVVKPHGLAARGGGTLVPVGVGLPSQVTSMSPGVQSPVGPSEKQSCSLGQGRGGGPLSILVKATYDPLLWVGLPKWRGGKESAHRCRRWKRHGLDPWVRKISWRRKLQPPPIFLPGKSHRLRRQVGYSPWGCRAGHDLSTEHTVNK